jgi:hypothetical protein
MILAVVLALLASPPGYPTSPPTIAPRSAICDDATLHAYAMQGAAIVANIRNDSDAAPIYARLDALSSRVDACARAALTRLGSSLEETDSSAAFAAIDRRMRMRVLRATAYVHFGDRYHARLELRDLQYDIGTMSDFTREHEHDRYADRIAIYNRYTGDLRRLRARLAEDERRRVP